MNRETQKPKASAAMGAHESERVLVLEALRGSPAAREELAAYLALVPAIVAVHRAHTSVTIREQEIPDLVQDCLSLIWRKLPEFEGRASLKTWIFRLCSYELLNGFRRVARLRRMQPLPADHDRAMVDARVREPQRVLADLDLRAGMEKLPAVEREIVHLRHYEDLTLDEVAARIGLKVNRVKARYYAAIRHLQEHLESRGSEGESR